MQCDIGGWFVSLSWGICESCKVGPECPGYRGAQVPNIAVLWVQGWQVGERDGGTLCPFAVCVIKACVHRWWSKVGWAEERANCTLYIPTLPAHPLPRLPHQCLEKSEHISTDFTTTFNEMALDCSMARVLWFFQSRGLQNPGFSCIYVHTYQWGLIPNELSLWMCLSLCMFMLECVYIFMNKLCNKSA